MNTFFGPPNNQGRITKGKDKQEKGEFIVIKYMYIFAEKCRWLWTCIELILVLQESFIIELYTCLTEDVSATRY